MNENPLQRCRAAKGSTLWFVSPLFFCLSLALVGESRSEERAPNQPQAAKRRPRFAQPVGPTQRKFGEINSFLFLPAPPRELKQALSAARRAIEEERFGEAVDALAEILDRPQTEDYFIKDEYKGSNGSLKQAALKALGGLPRAGREIYQLQFGAEAERLLEQAIATTDAEVLNEVTRRFFHTQAGYRASVLLARYHFDHGQPLAAAWHLRRVRESAVEYDRFEPELSLMLAACWQLAGNPKRAVETIEQLHEKDPSVTLPFREHGIPLAQVVQNTAAWLEDEFSNSAADASRTAADDWTMFRGDPRRNAASSGSHPISDFRWRIPTASDGEIRNLIAEMQGDQTSSDLPSLPVTHPIAVNNSILMRGPQRLFSVDLKSGKRIWTYPWDDEVEIPSSVENRRIAGWQITDDQIKRQQLRQRLWEDSIYGHISSDGESVFIVQEVPGDDVATSAAQGGIGFGAKINIVASFGLTPRANQLIALELATEGKTRWIAGGPDGDDGALKDAFFMGVPMPLDGLLYAIVEIRDEIKLVALDSDSGKLQWSQQLAHIDVPNTILVDGIRRLAGATPSYADGIIVCPTSAGTVVAVDVATRSLVWGYQYERSSSQVNRKGNNPWMNNFSSMPAIGKRWADASVTLSSGKVLLTPIESDQLHCLDLFTGKPVWDKPIPRGDWMYLATVHDENVVLVGVDKIEARRLSDGQPAWSAPLAIPNDERPSGRGFLIDHEYYLPTTAKQLVIFDVNDGALKITANTGVQLGNIICYEDQIISLATDWMHSFYQIDRLREKVEQQLAENPNDPQTLEDAGRLYVSDGQPQKSIETLQRAVEMYPADHPRLTATKKLLVGTALNVLQNDFASNIALVKNLQGYIDDADQKTRYLQLLAAELDRTGENAEALRTYLKLVDALPPFPHLDSDETSRQFVRLSRHHLIRNNAWINRRFLTLQQRITDEELAELQAAIAERLQATMEKSPETLQWQLNFFDQLPATLPARFRLAEDLAAQGRMLAATSALATLMDEESDEIAAQSTVRLSRLLIELNFPHEAAVLCRRAAELWPNQEVSDGKTAGQLLSELSDDPLFAPLLASQNMWNGGAVERFDPAAARTRANRGVATNRYQPYFPVRITDRQKVWDDGMQVALDTQLQEIVLLDRYGKLISRVPWHSQQGALRVTHPGIPHAKLRGHLLLLSLGHEVMAVDLNSTSRDPGERILWRQPVLSPIDQNPRLHQPQAKAFTVPYINPIRIYRAVSPDQRPIGLLGPLTHNRICFQQGKQLRALHPLSGQLQWSRQDFPSGCDLFGDDQHLFVVAPNSTTATVLDLVDGQTVTTRPIPEEARRWTTRGSRVLTWDGDNRGNEATTFKVYDVWQQEDVWNVELPASTRGCLIGDDEIAFLHPDGHFRVFNLDTGNTVIDDVVEREPMLQLIHVIRDDHRYMLITSQQDVKKIRRLQSKEGITVRAAPHGHFTSHMIDGRIYSFDRATGKQNWEGPARIENYGLPINQPYDVPVLVLMRQVNYAKPPPQQRSNRVLDLICIDRRDGRLVMSERNIAPTTRTLEVVGDPELQTAIIQLQNNTEFGLRFTKREKAAAPPAQSDRLLKDKEPSPLGKITGAVIDALGEQFRSIGESNTELIEELIDRIPDVEPDVEIDEEQQDEAELEEADIEELFQEEPDE